MFLKRIQLPGSKQLLDLPREIRTDARQRIELLGTVHFRELTRQAAYDLGGTPICPDPKHILRPDGQEIRHLVERGRDLFVMCGCGSSCKVRRILPTLGQLHYNHLNPSILSCGR